jgi:hypothetical protein
VIPETATPYNNHRAEDDMLKKSMTAVLFLGALVATTSTQAARTTVYSGPSIPLTTAQDCFSTCSDCIKQCPGNDGNRCENGCVAQNGACCAGIGMKGAQFCGCK